MKKLFGTALVVGASVLLSAPASADGYYEDKTLEFLIPVPGGSGLDLIARVFSDHLSKNIPGNPTIVPRNMPGGGGQIALNFLYDKAKPDGMTVYFGPWQAPAIINGDPGARYVPEEFAFIGAGHQPAVTLVRTDAGVNAPADVATADKFKLAGTNPNGSLDLPGNMAFDILGVNYRFIPGYKGMAKKRPAFIGNEVQAVHSGYVGYNNFFKNTMIKDGEAVAIWHQSNFDADGNAEADAGASVEMPAFHEVYEQVHGKAPSGDKWEAYKWYRTVVAQMQFTIFAPNGSPDDAIAGLRKGFADMVASEAFQEDFIKLNGLPLTLMPFEQGQEIVNTYRNVSPEILEVLKEMGQKGL